MKKLIGIGIAAMMVMGLGVAANASATDWLVYLKATDQAGANYLNSNNIYGWKTGATDTGSDSNDASNTAGSGSAVCLGAFDLGSGAANNGYSKELRAPESKAFDNKWHLKLWIQDGCKATDIKLNIWNPSGTYALPADGSKKITVTVLGQDYVLNGSKTGTATAPIYSILIADAQQYKGAANGLDVVISVPEPGSIVAMLSGLVGLAGFGIRRKK